MKKFGCLALLVVALFGAFGVYRAMFPPRQPSFAELSPQEQQRRRTQAQDLVEQVEGIANAAKKKEKRDFVLTATEEQLNTLLQDRLRMQNLPIRDLAVQLTPGDLTLNGTAKYQGFDVPVSISGNLQAVNGGIQYQISSLKLGGLPAPGGWRDKAQKAISDGLESALGAKTNAHIENVELREDSLTATGRTG